MRRFTAFFLIILLSILSSCELTNNSSRDSEKATVSSSGISSLKFSFDKATLDLEAGKNDTGYFKVGGNDNFSLDDIEFVSTNPTVAEFVYDSTALTNCIYYKINALKAGTSTVYAQTKDGAIKTSEILVTVSGYLYNIKDFDDTSVGNTQRMTLRTTVDENYYLSMTDDEISDMLKFITENYAKSHQMNAIIVYLFFAGDDVKNGDNIIAMSTYAPEGDIEKAPEVTAGDYSSFDYDISILSEAERAARRQ